MFPIIFFRFQFIYSLKVTLSILYSSLVYTWRACQTTYGPVIATKLDGSRWCSERKLVKSIRSIGYTKPVLTSNRSVVYMENKNTIEHWLQAINMFVRTC